MNVRTSSAPASSPVATTWSAPSFGMRATATRPRGPAHDVQQREHPFLLPAACGLDADHHCRRDRGFTARRASRWCSGGRPLPADQFEVLDADRYCLPIRVACNRPVRMYSRMVAGRRRRRSAHPRHSATRSWTYTDTNNHERTYRTPPARLDAASPSARLQAVLAIGTAADASDLDALIVRCAVEPDFFVRDMLTWALTRLPARSVLPRSSMRLNAAPRRRGVRRCTRSRRSPTRPPTRWWSHPSPTPMTRLRAPRGVPPSPPCRSAEPRRWVTCSSVSSDVETVPSSSV